MDLDVPSHVSVGRTRLLDELHRHSTWLRAVIWARSRDPDAVDDILQDLSVAVLKQSQNSLTVNNIPAWLYRIAVRHAIHHRRKSLRRQSREHCSTDEIETSRSHSPSPIDRLLQDEQSASIRSLLSELPGKESEILLLKYSEGLSYSEIALRLGISESSVEARLHRARQKMRNKLAARHCVGI